MRVLFATSLIAALVSAGGAPAAKGNTAKRNIDMHLAPPRYTNTKLLIPSSQTELNDGSGELSLQIILKADDDNRAKQELHTTLALTGIEFEDGMEINLGWAMYLPDESELRDQFKEPKP